MTETDNKRNRSAFEANYSKNSDSNNETPGYRNNANLIRGKNEAFLSDKLNKEHNRNNVPGHETIPSMFLPGIDEKCFINSPEDNRQLQAPTETCTLLCKNEVHDIEPYFNNNLCATSNFSNLESWAKKQKIESFQVPTIRMRSNDTFTSKQTYRCNDCAPGSNHDLSTICTDFIDAKSAKNIADSSVNSSSSNCTDTRPYKGIYKPIEIGNNSENEGHVATDPKPMSNTAMSPITHGKSNNTYAAIAGITDRWADNLETGSFISPDKTKSSSHTFPIPRNSNSQSRNLMANENYNDSQNKNYGPRWNELWSSPNAVAFLPYGRQNGTKLSIEQPDITSSIVPTHNSTNAGRVFKDSYLSHFNSQPTKSDTPQEFLPFQNGRSNRNRCKTASKERKLDSSPHTKNWNTPTVGIISSGESTNVLHSENLPFFDTPFKIDHSHDAYDALTEETDVITKSNSCSFLEEELSDLESDWNENSECNWAYPLIEVEPKDITIRDVLHGRGPICHGHRGNVTFRNYIKRKHPEYKDETKKGKTQICRAIIDWVHQQGGRFLEKDAGSGKFFVVNLKRARKKNSTDI